MFVIEFMDDVTEAVDGFCAVFYEFFMKPLIVAVIKMLIILSYPIWVVPYKIFRNNSKNQKSAEAYASEGEEEC